MLGGARGDEMLTMSVISKRSGSIVLAGLLSACAAEKEPPAKAESAAPAKAESPPAQPSSGPASASSKPADHPVTASTAQALKDLFKMPELEGDVVAKVGDRTVNTGALEHELLQMQIQLGATGLPPQLSRERVLRGAVDRLVEREMQWALAKTLGTKPDPGYAKQWLTDLEERMEAQPSFKSFLLQAGKDAEQRKADAERAALRQAIVDKVRAQVKGETEAEAKAYYDSHQADYTERAGTEVWRIFVKAPRGMVQRDRDIARGRAAGLLERAKKAPKNFPNIAISHSEGGKASTGGFIGWVSKGTLAPDLEKQLFAAKAGSILPLWEDASGFYVYKVGRSRKTRVRPFSEVADQILDKVYRTTITKKIDSELDRLRGETKVEILVPELQKKG